MKDKFVVDRSTWNNGRHGKGLAELLNKKGYRCCLGFVASQCGVSDEKLLKVLQPKYLKAWIRPLTDLHFKETELSKIAMDINDSPSLNDDQREFRLKELFAEHGYSIEFVGEYLDTNRSERDVTI